MKKSDRQNDIRARFAEIAALPDQDIPLDEAALLIAAEAEESVDVASYLGELDKLAIAFRHDRRFNSDFGIPVPALLHYIHTELEFSGNINDYYDPANSYLHRVIDHRTGIPISLALIHIAIGNRLDIPVEGISFPGHFLVRYGGDNGAIVDPFSGRELSKADCQTLLRQIAGPRATLRDEYFNPASSRDVLIRMLDNLKQIFWRERSWDQSKACIDRQLLLFPDQEEFNIQLGAVYEMQGNTSLAQHTYTEVLRGASDEQVRELASKRLLAMETRSKTVH
ncbi:MAG: transglutaminase family protein [Pseudomonadales bacterium]|jgi:regulator of sirC expression with transglutaminase-like and TPR domain|nr:transglutaminase family protein [Pseudomonadales bacterium]